MFPPICRISTAVAVLSAAVLVGLACSSSGLKTIAEAGVASGGQAGSTISSSGTNGGLGGTIGSGGAGGTNISGTGGIIGSGGSNGSGATAGSSGTGGTGGQGGRCGAISMCTTGQTVEWVQGEIDLSKDCPAERECYSLYSGCYTTLCVLPEGVVDAAIWQCPIPGQSCIPCGINACDAGPAGYCGDGIVETGEECDCGGGTIPVPGGCVGPNNDTTYGGCTTGCTWGPRCGDGVVQTNYGEQCDWGPLNGWCLDFQGNSVSSGCGSGITLACFCPGDTQEPCTIYCQFPVPWM